MITEGENMPKYKWSEFGKIKNFLELKEYLNEREFNHGSYCHYTSLFVIDSILKNKAFWIGCVKNFNDICDSDVFGDDKNLYYAICFSTGVNENLPLWYLYSGNDGKGGRLRLTKAGIKKFLSPVSLELYKRKDNELGDKVCALTKDDVEIKFNDVLYYKKDGMHISLKYNTMTNYLMLPEEFEKYKEYGKGFYKGLIWYYEKETRLLIRLKSENVINNLEDDCDYVIVWHFDDKLYNMFKIEFAPEVENVEEIISSDEYSHIKEFIYKTSNAKLSEYHSTIKMKR